jgi:hypothetical protein
MVNAKDNSNGTSNESAIEIKANDLSVQEKVELPTKNGSKVSTISKANDNDSTFEPYEPGSVDALQQWKQWLSEKNGAILAALLQRIPSPVTKPITLSELCGLFNLHYQPTAIVAKDLESVYASFQEWLGQFGYSYMALTNAVAKINTDTADLSQQLSTVAQKINSNQNVANKSREGNKAINELFS